MVGVPCDLSSTMHRHSACFRVLLFQRVQQYISSVYWCIYCCCRIDALKWIAGQSVYLFLNRHGQFGVYPSKIQVTHIPTNAVREDSPLDTLAFPGDVFCFNFVCPIDDNEYWLAVPSLSLRTRGEEHLFICLDFSLRAVWLESGSSLFIVHICVCYLYPMGRENVYRIKYF